MTPSDAAMNHLSSIGVTSPDLAVGIVEEFDWGWSVHVNSSEYWATRDPMKMFIGLSPVFVSKQLRCRTFPTGMSFKEMCSEFARECAS